jgi:hypothetical protein
MWKRELPGARAVPYKRARRRSYLRVTTQTGCTRLAPADDRNDNPQQTETERDIEVPTVTHAVGHILPLLSEAAGPGRVVKRPAGVETLISEDRLARVMTPQHQQGHDDQYKSEAMHGVAYP